MDQDTFLTTLYVMIDDFCQSQGFHVKHHPGPQASLSCREVVTLAVFGQWAQFPSERTFYHYTLCHLVAAFPTFPDREQFNRQQREVIGLHSFLLLMFICKSITEQALSDGLCFSGITYHVSYMSAISVDGEFRRLLFYKLSSLTFLAIKSKQVTWDKTDFKLSASFKTVEIFSFYSLHSFRYEYSNNISAGLCIVSKRPEVEKKDPVKGIDSSHKMKMRELLHYLIRTQLNICYFQ